METMFDNDAWQSFIDSGFYPYSLGRSSILKFTKSKFVGDLTKELSLQHCGFRNKNL